MPLPHAHSFILLQQRVDKQLAYNAGKFAYKTVSEKKVVAEALLDLGFWDVATLYRYFNQYKTADELRDVIGPVALEIIKTNAPGLDDNLAEIFVAGMASASKLEEIKKNVTFAASMLEEEGVWIPKEIKEFKSGLDRPTSFQTILRLRGPKGDFYGTGRIRNKPPGERRSRIKPAKDVDLNKYRGGGQISDIKSNTIVLDSENLVCNDLESLNSSNFNWKDILELIRNYRKRILCCIIVGGIVYLVFKKRKFLRRFLGSIKRLLKPIKGVYSKYKRVKKCKILNNRFSKGMFAFLRVVNTA